MPLEGEDFNVRSFDAYRNCFPCHPNFDSLGIDSNIHPIIYCEYLLSDMFEVCVF